MSPDRAGQFKLRDLLAATAVVGLLCVLVPILLVEKPYVGSRRSTCQSNQHNISLALMQFAEAHRHYPGYANNVATRTTSYLVPLMPYMEKSDVYQVWSKPDGAEAPPDATIYLNLLVCPSNAPINSTEPPTPM